jgi:hypothetical protein
MSEIPMGREIPFLWTVEITSHIRKRLKEIRM